MTDLPSVSVVLPVHRDGADLRRCLRSLAVLDPPPAEVIVVVDGADPRLLDLVEPHATTVRPVRPQRGPARARNAGARTATGDVLLFVDADVALQADLAGRVSRYLAENPDVDAVIGSYDDDPAEPNFLSQYKNLLNHYVHQRSRTEGYTFWGACGAIRREAFEALGGFDEAYATPSIEDIELGYRLRAAGGTIHVVRDLQVKHLKRWDARSLVRTDVVGRALPWSELILRSGGFDDDLNIDRAGRAKVALTMVAAAAAAGGARRRAAWATAAVSTAGLLALDAALLRFFARRRGWGFAAGAVPWLWLSYLYSAAAFGVACARHLVAGRGRPATTTVSRGRRVPGSDDRPGRRNPGPLRGTPRRC